MAKRVVPGILHGPSTVAVPGVSPTRNPPGPSTDPESGPGIQTYPEPSPPDPDPEIIDPPEGGGGVPDGPDDKPPHEED